ncbi:MAG: hypothetical protein QOG85_2446 [Gaiellaceae bacterium]|nr:hypothetical protein [Gaiellaceae bacterium]
MFGRRRSSSDAGRHLLDYYEHRLKLWRRQLWPVFAISAILGALGAIPFWLYAPHGQFYAGLWVGATEVVIFSTWDSPPEFIAKWKRGGDGEKKTAEILKRLEDNEWRSYHGRKAKYGDIDHVAVGPAGVYLLDSKNLYGRLSVEEAGLTATYGDFVRDSYAFPRLGGSLTREAINLKERIQTTTGVSCKWVQAIVVIWGDFPEAETEQDDVLYIAGERLEGWLRDRRGRLSEHDLRLVQAGFEAEVIVGAADPLVPDASAVATRN